MFCFGKGEGLDHGATRYWSISGWKVTISSRTPSQSVRRRGRKVMNDNRLHRNVNSSTKSRWCSYKDDGLFSCAIEQICINLAHRCGVMRWPEQALKHYFAPASIATDLTSCVCMHSVHTVLVERVDNKGLNIAIHLRRGLSCELSGCWVVIAGNGSLANRLSILLW